MSSPTYKMAIQQQQYSIIYIFENGIKPQIDIKA